MKEFLRVREKRILLRDHGSGKGHIDAMQKAFPKLVDSENFSCLKDNIDRGCDDEGSPID